MSLCGQRDLNHRMNQTSNSLKEKTLSRYEIIFPRENGSYQEWRERIDQMHREQQVGED
jgi:hypothetical protein